MFYLQKKTYKSSSSKSKYNENEHWDVNIPPEPFYDKKKRKRYGGENDPFTESTNKRPYEKKGYNTSKRWTHDKYDDNINSRTNNKFSYQQKSYNEKKPEKVLYSVREKMNHNDDSNESQEHIKKDAKKEDLTLRPNSAKETLGSINENGSQLKDDRSFISNLSQAISEKPKTWEDEIKGLKGIKDQIEIDQLPVIDLMHSVHAADPHVLFEVLVHNDQGTTNSIIVWDNEKSYEAFLDRICEENNIEGRMALYFQINILKRLRDSLPNNKEVVMLLNKLLDLNFRVILHDLETVGNTIVNNSRPIHLMHATSI